MDLPIVYQDEYFFIIDKPSGVVVNRAQSVKEETIQDWAEKKLKTHEKEPENGEDFYSRAGIVHRLDKETSGLLLIAKTPQAFLYLQKQFKERTIHKKYLTLVHGNPVPEQGEIKASVGRLPWNRQRFGVLPGGREAITCYRILSRYKYGNESFSLLEVAPHTGRTHQIRIHLKYLRFPVVADEFYAGRKTYRRDLDNFPRLFLHAYYLQFVHPITGEAIEVKSELPKDLKEVLEKLKLDTRS